MDLVAIRGLLDALDHPERRVAKIIVGGTNGKGSVSAMLSALLVGHGLRVGLYTSPHLVEFRERYRIQDRMITQEELERVAAIVDSAIHERSLKVTYFERATAMAYVLFAQAEVDGAVMEVGLGGRLDATNVGPSQVAVLTDVGLDHQDVLGESLEKIAYEKIAIVPDGGICVTVPQKPEVEAVFQKELQHKRARVYVMGRDFTLIEREKSSFQFSFGETCLSNVRIPFAGEHQIRNTALALAAYRMFVGNIDSKANEALLRSDWPGRMQVVCERPYVMVDGAHNVDGMQALANYVDSESIPREKSRVLFAAKRDKNLGAMLRAMGPSWAALLAVDLTIDADRGREAFHDPKEVIALAAKLGVARRYQAFSDVSEAWKEARRGLGQEDFLLVCGSLYLVGKILREVTETKEYLA